jgi:hypothetical protein
VLGISRAMAYESCRRYRLGDSTAGIPNIQMGRRVLVLTERLYEILELGVAVTAVSGEVQGSVRVSHEIGTTARSRRFVRSRRRAVPRESAAGGRQARHVGVVRPHRA